MTTDTTAQVTPQAADSGASQTDPAKGNSVDTAPAKTALTQDPQAKPDAADPSKSQPSDAKDKDGSHPS